MKIKMICLAMMLTSSVSAQTVEGKNWAVKLTWDANPVVENVETYLVSWFDGDRNLWIKLDNVAHVDNSQVSYVNKLTWIKSTLEVGSEICFNVIAIRGDEQSEPSDNACGVIVNHDATVTFTISKPGNVSVEFPPQ